VEKKKRRGKREERIVANRVEGFSKRGGTPLVYSRGGGGEVEFKDILRKKEKGKEKRLEKGRGGGGDRDEHHESAKKGAKRKKEEGKSFAETPEKKPSSFGGEELVKKGGKKKSGWINLRAGGKRLCTSPTGMKDFSPLEKRAHGGGKLSTRREITREKGKKFPGGEGGGCGEEATLVVA